MATRLFLLLIVVVAAVLGWPAWQHQRALREKAVAEIQTGQTEQAASELPPKFGTGADTEEERHALHSSYRFIDGDGTLRFVDSLDKVPDAYRASARQVTLGPGSSSSDTSSDSVARPSRASSKPPRRRPFSDTYAPLPPYHGPSSANSLSDE